MNATVVVRATQERTLELCRQLVEREVGSDEVVVLKTSPHWRMVQKTFETGLARRTKWTIAIDADVLPFPNAIQTGIRRAASLGENLYCYTARFKDKVFGEYRSGGIRFYNTQLLPEAINALEETKTNVRSESSIYKRMARNGYITYTDNEVLALHDYEQSYADYFRKGYFHAKKHYGARSISKLLTHWKQHIHGPDDDYRALFAGWTYGFSDTDEVVNAAEHFQTVVAREFPKLGFSEKPPLCMDLNHWLETLNREKAVTAEIRLKPLRIPQDRINVVRQHIKKTIKTQLRKFVG